LADGEGREVSIVAVHDPSIGLDPHRISECKRLTLQT